MALSPKARQKKIERKTAKKKKNRMKAGVAMAAPMAAEQHEDCGTPGCTADHDHEAAHGHQHA